MRLDARDKLPWPVPPGIKLNFGEMLAHAGHELTVRVYKASNVPMETALVCKTCGWELHTASNPVANHAIQLLAIALYLDEFGQNKAMPFIVECQSWNGCRVMVEDTVYARIPKERVQSIMGSAHETEKIVR